VFHILLYLGELEGPDRGNYLVAGNLRKWSAIRDGWEARVEELAEFLDRR